MVYLNVLSPVFYYSLYKTKEFLMPDKINQRYGHSNDHGFALVINKGWYLVNQTSLSMLLPSPYPWKSKVNMLGFLLKYEYMSNFWCLVCANRSTPSCASLLAPRQSTTLSKSYCIWV